MKLAANSAVVAVLVVALGGCSGAAKRRVAPQQLGTAPVAAGTAEPAREAGVIAYYFHGAIRCETCLKIERQARELISSRFAAEVASKRLEFKSVNYDEPENEHFFKDYRLPCPSLVLVRQSGRKDWRVLGRTWEFVQVPPKLEQYIEEETAKFLQGNAPSLSEDPGGTNGSSATNSVGGWLWSLSDMYGLTGEVNAVLVFLPGKDRGPTASTLAAVRGAKTELEEWYHIKLGLFTLAPGSRDYEEMLSKMSGPGVLVVVKTGARKYVSGELTEERIVDGFMGAVATGGCCPLGYPGEGKQE